MTGTNRILSVLLIAICSTRTGFVYADSPISTSASTTGIIDVILSEDGRLHGWLLDNQGQAIGGAVVVLKQRGTDCGQTVTDVNGRYELAGLSGGIYHLQVGHRQCVIRVWDQPSAPPAAVGHLSLVLRDPVVRGQSSNPAALFDGSRGYAGLGMIGIALGTITVIGVEVTDNDDQQLPSLNDPMPPGGTTVIISP